MRDYSNIIKGMTSTLWLMHKESLLVLVDIVNRRLEGSLLTDEEIKARIEAAENGDRNLSRVEVGGGVGVLPIYGSIFPKANLMTEVSGATSLEQVRADIQSLASNDDVSTIVLDIDSPGGSADMVEETGLEILRAKESKPVYAVANTMACSAAHWLGSMASKFYSTPSGKVGSLGVYTLHEDISERDKAEGRKITVISAGELKGTHTSHEPLTAEGRAYLQANVDELHETFIQAVASGRNLNVDKVREYADGRILSANQALKVGAIDGIKSLDSVVGELLAQNHVPAYGVISSAMRSRHKQFAATNTSNMLMEVADKEHSEPGSGQPEPTPRERESEPVRFHPQTDPLSDENNPEGSTTMEEAELRELLGIGEDADIAEHLTSLMSVQAERERAAADSRTEAEFAEQYPEQAQALASLQARDRANAASNFANQFRAMEISGRRYTLATPMLDRLEAAHLAVAQGEMDIEAFSNLLSEVARAERVELGERGNIRTPEGMEPEAMIKALNAEARKMVSESEGKISLGDAIAAVATEHPDWYEAYRENVPTRPNR